MRDDQPHNYNLDLCVTSTTDADATPRRAAGVLPSNSVVLVLKIHYNNIKLDVSDVSIVKYFKKPSQDFILSVELFIEAHSSFNSPWCLFKVLLVFVQSRQCDALHWTNCNNLFYFRYD